MAATLSGTITNIMGVQLDNNIVVRFFEQGTTNEVMRAASVSNAAGVFIVTGITPGTYDVGIKPQGALSELVLAQVFTDGVTTNIVFGNTRWGDLNFDDIINVADRNVMYGYWNIGGDCFGYPGDWHLPCDIPADDCGGGGVAAKGAAYKIIGGQPTVI